MNTCTNDEHSSGICIILVHNSTGHDLSDSFVSRDQMLSFKAPTCCSHREFDPNLHWGSHTLFRDHTSVSLAIQGSQGGDCGWSRLVAIWEQNSGPECDRHCIPGRLKEGLTAVHPTAPNLPVRTQRHTNGQKQIHSFQWFRLPVAAHL